jgi:prepilin-type N-terminal cleavage/methylation domain-containing protein
MNLMRARDESGFTLIETLVSLSLLAIITTVVYSVMLSGVRSSEKSRSVANTAQEARLGFNRMIRDTREAGVITSCPSVNFNTCYGVKIDFNGDGTYSNPNPLGDYEDLTYEYVAGDRMIKLNGQALIGSVHPIPGKQIFTYLSNSLAYDANNDGVTTALELDGSGVAGVGNGNGAIDGPELAYITSVSYAFRLEQGAQCSAAVSPNDPCETFFAEAQLRNRR